MVFVSIFSKNYYNLLNTLHVLKFQFKDESKINVFYDSDKSDVNSYLRAAKIFPYINWRSSENYYVKQFDMFLESECKYFVELSSDVFYITDMRHHLSNTGSAPEYFYTYEKQKLFDRYQKALMSKESKYGDQIVQRHAPWPFYNKGMAKLLMNYYKRNPVNISHQILSPLMVQAGKQRINIRAIQLENLKSLGIISFMNGDLKEISRILSL